jgi:serine/threonine protein kinase
MELCSMNFLSLLQNLNHKGLRISVIQAAARQLLEALALFRRLEIVHSDIKPENILLADGCTEAIKVVDFGAARCAFQRSPVYAQSRYYRAPEVILHLPWSFPADIWSVGCVIGELFTGLPLFPGQSEIHMLHCYEKLIGPCPLELLELSPRVSEFYLDSGVLKSQEQYYRETRTQPRVVGDYITATSLSQLLTRLPLRTQPGVQSTPQQKMAWKTRLID